MKKAVEQCVFWALLGVMVLGIFSSRAWPQESVEGDQQVSKSVLCSTISSLAEQIMSSRQAGVSMERMIEMAEATPERFKPMVEAMTIGAFETPRYQTEGPKRRAIEDFRDEAYLSCYRGDQ